MRRFSEGGVVPVRVVGTITDGEKLSEPVSVASIPVRPRKVSGSTYKIKVGDEPALYVTINHIEVGGQKFLFEIFLSTKKAADHQWVVALTRVISGVFRINVARKAHDGNRFLVDELKQVLDPNGGFFRPGKFVPSIVAEIGYILEEELGVLEGQASQGVILSQVEREQPAQKIFCKKCYSTNMRLMDGCWVCSTCGDSKCG